MVLDAGKRLIDSFKFTIGKNKGEKNQKKGGGEIPPFSDSS